MDETENKHYGSCCFKLIEVEEDEEKLPKFRRSSSLSTSSMACARRAEDVKLLEETEDCFVLEFDPFEPMDISKLCLTSRNEVNGDDGNDDDVSIIAEKGEVACRDFPHSRHLCPRFPFGTTPHETHCEKCYCYVCDSAAPCKAWVLDADTGHCHATEHVTKWTDHRRDMMIKRRSIELPVQKSSYYEIILRSHVI